MTSYDFKSNNGGFGRTCCFRMVQVSAHVEGTSVKSVIRYATAGGHNAGHREFSFVCKRQVHETVFI